MLPDLKIWLNHFEYHAERPRGIPDGLRNFLTPAERQLISKSIATFQLGESSQGATLLRAARQLAQAQDAPDLPRLIELFIREEQRHAALLRVFMDEHAIPLKQRDWTDRVFRRVRRLAGFELCVSVLVTAELIGNVYYRALESATGCQRLKVLCRTLVADELVHVAFESDLLLALRAQKPRALRTVIRLVHRAFFFGAAFVVWCTHGAVLRAAGYRTLHFFRACDAQYSFYLKAPRANVPSPWAL
jgi:hypothetical protein